MIPSSGKILRIYIGENDHYEGRPLYEWIVRAARDGGMCGATVIRGIAGFGAHSRVHTAKILRLSEGLPIIIELIDSKQKIETFISQIDPVIEEGLVVVEDVSVRFYGTRTKRPEQAE